MFSLVSLVYSAKKLATFVNNQPRKYWFCLKHANVNPHEQ